MTYLKKYFLLGMLMIPLCSLAGTSFFVKNEGQISNSKGERIEEVFCFYKGKKFDVYFHRDKISYVFKKERQETSELSSDNLGHNYIIDSYRVDLEFLFSNTGNIEFNKSTIINHKYMNTSVGELTIKKGYQEIVYKNIYEGVELRFYFQKDRLKYDFIVHPKADYKSIKMKYVGAKKIINKLSKIIIETPLGNLEETIPEIFQQTEMGKRIIKGEYLLKDEEVSFIIKGVNPNQKLIIDPWATFIGGVDIEEAYSTTIDSQKNTYVTGYTGSSNFPITAGVLQTTKQGLFDAFLTKLDTTGNVLWSTFYGGIGDEFGYSVLVDSDDNPYMIGYTNGNDILVSPLGVHQTTSNGSIDSFILKLDSAGNLIWGTYFGGSGGEIALTADIDNDENILIGGFTSSVDMPTVNSFQNVMGGALDAFIAKFDSTGNLLWSTYNGGTNSEDVHILKVDNQNNVIITGETFSSDFPTSGGAFQSNNNGNLDLFLTKYNPLGNRIFSTYFGGTNSEDANGLTTDNLNNIYVVGYSESNDFPMIGSAVYQNIKDVGRDGVVVKFSPLGQPMLSTFIGGNGDDVFTSAEISSTGSLYIAGYTNSTNAPIIGTPFQNINNGLTDGIYYKLDTVLTPNYSTYIGGVSADFITDMSIDSNQLLTFVGYTSSLDFPVTSNVFQEIIAGQSDAFVFQSDSIFNVITNLPISFQSNEIFTIYPNPFHHTINLSVVEFDNLDNYQVVMYSVDGKKVFSRSVSQEYITIQLNQNIKSGNYIIALLKDNEVISSKKLIKN